MESEIDLKKYTDILLKRWLAIIAIAVVAGFIVGLIGLIQPSTYEAKASALVTGYRTELILAPEYESSQKVDIFSQRTALVALVKSSAIANKVIEQLGDDLTIDEQKSANLLMQLQVTEQGDLIEISWQSTNAQKAADIANAWAEAYEIHINNLYSGISISQEELQNIAATALTEYETAQTAWETFIGDNRINEISEKIDDKELLIDIKSLRTQIATNPASTTSIAANNLSVILLQASAFTTVPDQLLQFSAEQLSALTTDVDEIDDLITTLETRSGTTAGKTISELRAEILALREQLEKESDTERELRSTKTIAWETYTTLESKTAEVQVTSLAPDAIVRVADNALVPTSPISRNTVQNTVIAIILGLIVGILVAFIIEYFQNSNRKNGETE